MARVIESAPADAQSPRLLTFEDLVALTEQRRDRATAPDSLEGWDRLLQVARALAGGGTSDGDIARGRIWRLLRVRIEGYQGVGVAPLEIDFDPTPGVTVLQGPNGSGKSSIADAIETALHGVPRAPTATGAGGNAPLWEREQCGRDVTEASVETTLIAGREQLVLSCRLNRGGQVTQRQVRRIADDGTSTDIDPSATTWRSALAGHRPVFGYAAVERQVQLARNLQEFLEPLLAFGGCFDALKAGVKDAGATSAAARSRWDRALADAQRAVAAVDQQRTRPDAVDLPAVVWPAIADDPGGWLAMSGLTETGATAPEVTEEHADRLRDSAAGAAAALDALEAAETSLHARLAGPLTDLHHRAEHLDEHGRTCPVCDTADVPWRSALATTVGGLTATETEDRMFRERLVALRQGLAHDLTDVESALGQDWCAAAVREQAAATLELCNALRGAVDAEGQRATSQVRAAVRAACTNLLSEPWRRTVADLARQSDHHSQWSRARRAAVENFLSTWRETGTDGAAATGWVSAETCLRKLQNQLRKQRTEGLQALAATSVHTLLQDVGLRITGLSVQGTKAGIEVTDGSGKPVRLSMLSAGQRNALLLAPLLAVSRGGPFGFLVLDDPVHAFDQLRVDRLAQLVHDLAAERRVIVLTHDERLKEHLLARSPRHDARAVARNHIDGRVTQEPTHDMWRVLLDDARATWKLASKPANMTVTATDLVRGMCRMALDDALRRFVLQEAVRTHRDPDPDLARLDEPFTTRDRIVAVEALHPAHPQIAAAKSILEPHLDDWNRAAHGSPPTSAVHETEIDASEAGCRTLLGIP
jgi:hypothetical protein